MHLIVTVVVKDQVNSRIRVHSIDGWSLRFYAWHDSFRFSYSNLLKPHISIVSGILKCKVGIQTSIKHSPLKSITIIIKILICLALNLMIRTMRQNKCCFANLRSLLCSSTDIAFIFLIFLNFSLWATVFTGLIPCIARVIIILVYVWFLIRSVLKFQIFNFFLFIIIVKFKGSDI